jgi:hypothetical protein
MHDDLWKRIVEVHGHAKALTLRAEELDPQHEFFFAPVIQQRDAHDHILRAQSAELGLRSFEDTPALEDYVTSNLDKALGHEYRAFFDTADWLAILYREKILAALHRYSSESIAAVIPTYYQEIVPKVEKLHREIAAIRNGKDVGAGEGVLEQVQEYRSLLEGLDEDWCRIIDAKSGLEQRRRDARRRGLWSILVKVAVGVLLALVGAIVGWFAKGCG